MTLHKGFKDRVRERMVRTGESYAAAHAHVAAARERLLNGGANERPQGNPPYFDRSQVNTPSGARAEVAASRPNEEWFGGDDDDGANAPTPPARPVVRTRE